jgi:hypothetical protein
MIVVILWCGSATKSPQSSKSSRSCADGESLAAH